MFPKLSNYVMDNGINITTVTLDVIKEYLILFNREIQHYTPRNKLSLKINP